MTIIMARVSMSKPPSFHTHTQST